MGLFSRRDREPRVREPRRSRDPVGDVAYRDPVRRADESYRDQVEQERLRDDRLREEDRVRRSYER